MATWRDVRSFVRREYQVMSEDSDEIRILFEFDDERSQVIVLVREVLDRREEWVQIASPIGLAANIDLKAILEEVGHRSVVGGLVIMGEHLAVRHSLPLANLDINELVDPLHLLAGTADHLEELFGGGDHF
ncbi:MAG TPA: hypothetical protein VIL00_14645 [Pseudonocardiaceae bacterium]|mgnify:CR=1 FL=1